MTTVILSAASRELPSLQAIAALLEAPLPDALYRLVGDLGFRYALHRHGVHQRDLRARPLDR